MNDLQVLITLEDVLTARNDMLGRYAEAVALIREAHEKGERIHPLVNPTAREYSLASVELYRQELDRRMWRHAMRLTRFNLYLDCQARNEFEAALERDPPPFTMESIRGTFAELQQKADAYFARGVYNLFVQLSPEYVSNTKDRFGITPGRMVLEYAADVKGFLHPFVNERWGGKVLTDLHRVLCAINGTEFEERSLINAVNRAFHDGAMEYVDNEIRLKLFKNGNAHLWLLNPKTIDRVNEIIASATEGNILATRAERKSRNRSVDGTGMSM